MLVSSSTNLQASLAAATEPTLAGQLYSEATALEEAFALKKWQHTELDGGRFAEVAARIVYGFDSGAFNLGKPYEDCVKYIENTTVTHAFPDAKSAHQILYVLRAIYKLRSQRGAVHVSPTYTANEIDSRLVVEGVRWVLAELLRLFATSDQAALVAAIEELSRFPTPLIRNFGGQPFVQSINFTTEEEVLVHLLHDRNGMTQADLVKVIPKDPSGVRKAIKALCLASKRHVKGVDDLYLITDPGINRIEARMIEENKAA
jgi:hypothetical protein